MVGQTRAGIIAQIGQLTTPKITEGRSVDLAGAMRNFVSGFNQGKEWKADKLQTEAKNAYIDALQSGDENAINQAWADYDPAGYAKAMQDQKAIAEQRAFQEKMQQQAFNNQWGLAKYRERMAQNAIDDENARLQNALDSGLISQEEYNQKRRSQILGDIAKGAEPDVSEEQSKQLAQNAINTLGEVAKDNKIGVFTDWRRGKGLISKDTEREYGRISSAVAGVAPRAIANLKKAGVSGINSLQEFMTYIGLPQNPTSQQIAGALPLMAEIAGVENPIKAEQKKSGLGLFGSKQPSLRTMSDEDLLKGL